MAGGVTTAVIVLPSTILMLDMGTDAETWVASQSPSGAEVKPDPVMMIGLSTPSIQRLGVTEAMVIVGQLGLGWDGAGGIGGAGGSIEKSYVYILYRAVYS
jgi:hypothetical protein